ncbi:TPA: flagellar basal body L-ring protein FlgH [Vibrio vulnificus]|uniref:Flagellar basal body L-ring protein FlgH n=1 Tax=Vibrio vulnificus TaxID=672 RepID=A0A8H9TFP9_VIBVL|nr:flagellar basal body L-ring protein FlgH [Vibrio vulnificus]HAS8540941.1 flagellar basal body L-ring protein FlgH [Vibrio vulnificus]
MKKSMHRSLMAACVAGLLSACVSNDIPKQEDLSPFTSGDIAFPTKQISNGSIFSGASSPLMIGVGRSYNVGDIVIVRMSEDINAQDSTKSKVSQKSSSKSSMGLNAPNFIDTPYSIGFDMGHDEKVEGSGASSQSHSLEGSIAATVTSIYPNGVLELKGYKEITLENGIETIAITGRVREQDISTTDNSVSSNRLADAKIYYKGSGEIYDKSQSGWLTDVITGKYWPF